jgi:hypothetical protein
MDELLHVVPKGEENIHETNILCWCHPLMVVGEDGIIYYIHFSPQSEELH